MTGTKARNNLPRRTAQPGEANRNRTAIAPLTRVKAMIPSPLRRHPRITTTVLVALAAGAITTTALLGGAKPSPTAIDPRTRVYANYSACLLTDAHGTSQTPASAVWAGMQAATNTTNERVRTLPITGPQTLAVAETFLNTLALQGCNLIAAVEPLPTQATTARATAFPHTHFLLIAPTAPTQKSSNITYIRAGNPDTLTSDVAQALATDYHTYSNGD
jgi:hypothetical protein